MNQCQYPTLQNYLAVAKQSGTKQNELKLIEIGKVRILKTQTISCTNQ